MINDDDIETLLQNWYQTKLDIVLLEKKCDKYKNYAEKILNTLEKDSIATNDFTLKRNNMSRSTISKKDVPVDIWKEYSNVSTFKAYYLVPKKKKNSKKQ